MVETLVAMVIIMICAGIAFTLFANLSRDVNDELRIEAEIRSNTWAIETKQKKDFTEAEIETENLRLQRMIQVYKKNKRVKVLMIEAFSQAGKKICEYKELITIN